MLSGTAHYGFVVPACVAALALKLVLCDEGSQAQNVQLSGQTFTKDMLTVQYTTNTQMYSIWPY
jgi:hypothetical protein